MLGHNGRVLRFCQNSSRFSSWAQMASREEVLTVLVDGHQQFVGKDERMGNHLGAALHRAPPSRRRDKILTVGPVPS